MTTGTSAAQDWGSVAAAWDAKVDYVDGHSAPATDALVAALAVQPGDRVLELAAGPGSLGATWSRLSGPSGRVVLSDIAPDMVRVASVRNGGLGNVEVDVLDAGAIDSPDAAFDVVACRMGLMFTPDPAVALAEIRRVLAPGGRFGALTWAGIAHNPWMACVGMAAVINGLMAGAPPVGPGGVFSLGEPERLATLAGDAGFASVRVDEIALTFRSDSIDTHVATVGSLAGPLAAAFDAATPEQLAAVRATAADLLAGYISGDGLSMPGRALLVTGAR